MLQCLHVQTRQPVKVVRWEVNGTVLHRSTSLSKLAIQKANVSDTGNYSCFARLNNQIHVAYVKLRVYGKLTCCNLMLASVRHAYVVPRKCKNKFSICCGRTNNHSSRATNHNRNWQHSNITMQRRKLPYYWLVSRNQK